MKEIYYPKYGPSKPFYDNVRNPNGGYGGLFSVTFHTTPEATAFFDNLEVMKGPSLGTNFTLRQVFCCLYNLTLIANGKPQLSVHIDSTLQRVGMGKYQFIQ